MKVFVLRDECQLSVQVENSREKALGYLNDRVLDRSKEYFIEEWWIRENGFAKLYSYEVLDQNLKTVRKEVYHDDLSEVL